MFKFAPSVVAGVTQQVWRNADRLNIPLNGNNTRPPNLPAEESSREAVSPKEIPHGRKLGLYWPVIRVILRVKPQDIEPFADVMSKNQNISAGLIKPLDYAPIATVAFSFSILLPLVQMVLSRAHPLQR